MENILIRASSTPIRERVQLSHKIIVRVWVRIYRRRKLNELDIIKHEDYIS